MKLYRVTVETLTECYVYEIEAKDKASAKRQAVELASQDGMNPYRRHWMKAERL